MPTQAAILPSTMRCGTAGRTHMRSFPSCVPRCGTEAAANSGPQLGYTEGGEGLSMRGYHPPPPSPSVPGTPGAREGAAEGVLLAAKAHLSHPFLGGNHVPVCLSLSQSVTVARQISFPSAIWLRLRKRRGRLDHGTGTALASAITIFAPSCDLLCSLDVQMRRRPRSCRRQSELPGRNWRDKR
ncbi:hypothetical protein N431DRAFT_442777 [Stipitochalara longipes BDJ]|nr:hypothetical protein N431DRAFT_442777 [Stipitochalara longipes BDJ]